MITALIVAHGKNGQIGLNNKMLWHISEDFKKFKALTSGHTIIMGRKTFESLPGVLPNRKHIVITSNEINIKTDDDVITTSSVEEALKCCSDEERVFIIGGATVYNHCIENHLIDEFYLSEVDYDGDADTFITNIDLSSFELISTEHYDAYKTNKDVIIPEWTFKYYKR